jgi:MYXO-CTERM domain-containing protein
MSIKNPQSRIAAVIAASLSITAAGTAIADSAPPTIVLQTVNKILPDTAKAVSTGPISKQNGAGVMDTSIAADDNGFVFMTWTQSVKPNGTTGVQGAIAVAKINATGTEQITLLKPPADLPALNGERTHMRPLAGLGKNILIDIFASEDNGQNNNPQNVAWVFDKTGKMIPITNSTRGAQNINKPTNLIQLSGKNDDQQYGPHSICSLGAAPDGTEAFIVGTQRQNQNSYVMRVNVKPTLDANGMATAAQVTVPWFTRLVDNAQHTRPQVECPAPGTTLTRTTRVMTSVEANSQPADIGVRAVLFDINTGAKLQSKLIAASNPGKNMYAVQPSIAAISEGVVAIEWQKSEAARVRNGNNGHAGGVNLSMLTTLKITGGADTLTKLDEVARVSPYQRHAHTIGSLYGEGDGKAAVGVMGGSSTGTGKGMVQMINVDQLTGKIDTVQAQKLYTVSNYSDVANLPARGKRNPNNQAAGFINGIGGVKNPGFGMANGFMPEVASFTLSAIPGYKDAATSTMLDANNKPIGRESLIMSLIPSTWTPAVQTVPGSVVADTEVKPGPTPTIDVPAPTDPAATPDPFGTGNGDGTGDNGGPGGVDDPNLAGSSGGSGCSTAPSSTTSGLGGLALAAIAFLFTARRRNSSKKES